jgi:hypothetical protein
MTAVTNPTIARRALDRLRTAAVVAALACASNMAYAQFASVVIDDFFFTANPGNATSFIFAPTDTMFNAWDLQTFAGAAPTSAQIGSTSAWPPFLTMTATGPQAGVAGTFQQGTDPTTAQPTPSFSLSATVNPVSNGVLYQALGQWFTAGSYCFYDSALDPNHAFNGTSAFCTGSGSIDFFLQYDLIVAGGPGTSAYADFNVDSTSLGSFIDFASTIANTGSLLDQHLIWTATVAAGDAEFFSLTGNVVAQAIPEPGMLPLVALGLVVLAATRRRSARRVS